MNLEHLAVNLMEQPTQQDHVQSQLYTLSNSVNPLVAAASPLMSLVNRINLENQQQVPSLTWHHACIHELVVFKSWCHKHGFDLQTTILAQWFLSQWLNQTLNLNCSQNIELPREFNNLLQQSNPITAIVEQLLTMPDENLELIELIYILCRLGMNTSPKRLEQEHHIQQFYYLIQQHQATQSKALRQIHYHQRLAQARQLQFSSRQQQWAWGIICSMLCFLHCFCFYQFGVIQLNAWFLRLINH